MPGIVACHIGGFEGDDYGLRRDTILYDIVFTCSSMQQVETWKLSVMHYGAASDTATLTYSG